MRVPFAPTQLVVSAIDELNGAHPLTVVTIPALLRAAQEAGRDPVADGVEFGSTEETKLFDDYFVLPRPPDPDRPWRAPWSEREPWQKRKYPGGGLQRIRTDNSGRGRILLQRKQQPRDLWLLTPAAGQELIDVGAQPVRIVDLALWLGREQDVADLDALIAWFNDTFEPNQGDLVGTIYLDDVPDAYRAVPFAYEPAAVEDSEQLGSLPAAPTVELTLPELVDKLEGRMRAAGYRLPIGLVRRILTAWLRGDIAVLVGQPGTGKTMFASLLGRAMHLELGLDVPVLIPVRPDFDESEFIGYERLDGTPQLREFADVVLQAENPLDARVVVLEEFNLAAIESYFAPVLIAAQEQERLIRLPAGLQSQLPVDTFFIATCNSYRDEPETRTRISSPTKRRSTIVTMPNVLSEQFGQRGGEAVLDLAMRAVKVEANRIAARLDINRAAQFDGLRAAALGSVTELDDLSESVRTALVAVCSAILTTNTGRSWFTLGLLKDVILAVVHAERDEASELEALGQAVADKIVHQVRGRHEDVQDLLVATAELPNAEEIEALLARTMDGPSDELIPLV